MACLKEKITLKKNYEAFVSVHYFLAKLGKMGGGGAKNSFSKTDIGGVAVVVLSIFLLEQLHILVLFA
jgi:hypothetical protein